MFLLDSSSFITAAHWHYPLKEMPSFWQWLDVGHEAGILGSTERVRQELVLREDDLARWAAIRGSMFPSPDAVVLPSLKVLAKWAFTGDFAPAGAADFLASPDYETVACAHARGHTVVTYVQPNILSRTRIPLPDACAAMGVPWTDIEAFLHQTGDRLFR